jgi:hypothetical protein
MSDVVWQALIGAVATVVLAYLQVRNGQKVDAAGEQNKKASDAAAGKAEEVKEALDKHTVKTDQKLDGIAETSDRTHALVNNAMAVQLRLNATTARRLAELTKDQKDVDAADAAEKLVAVHQERQAASDALGPH